MFCYREWRFYGKYLSWLLVILIFEMMGRLYIGYFGLINCVIVVSYLIVEMYMYVFWYFYFGGFVV